MADTTAKIVKTIEHPRQLWMARYSPCGKFLFAAGYDARIPRWEISEAEPKRLESLAGHAGWSQSIAFAGEVLISTDSWGRAIGWKYAEEAPQPVWNIEHALNGWIRTVAVSPDGAHFAIAGNDSVIKVLRVADGSCEAELGPHPESVFSVAFHPDGKSLVSGDFKGTLRQWNLADRSLTRTIELAALYRLDRIQDCGGVRCMAFDQTGGLLLCGGMKDPPGGFAEGAPLVLALDWSTGQVKHELQHGDKTHGFIYDAQFHPTGFVMATSCAMPSKGLTWFWRLGAPAPFFVGSDLANGRSLCLHPNGSRLALVSSVAINANGRPADGQYVDGTARIHLLDLT